MPVLTNFIVDNKAVAADVAYCLIYDMQKWFQCTPLLNGKFEFTVMAEGLFHTTESAMHWVTNLKPVVLNVPCVNS